MKLLTAFFAGILLPFAFAPYTFYPLAVLSLVLFLRTLEKKSPGTAGLYGFFYGLGCFGKGVYWIYISIHEFGNSSIFIAGTITLLFVSVLALFPAVNAYLFNRFFSDAKYYAKYWLAFPALWTLIEWIRSWIFTGFPWLLLGQSQTGSPLQGYAPVLGVYGVSFLVVLSAGLLFAFGRQSQKSINTYSYLFLGIIWLTGLGLYRVQWTKPLPGVIPVTLVQGNIPQTIKWSPDQAFTSLTVYEKLTEENWPFSGGLVVWPETAVTLLFHDALPWLDNIDDAARQKHIGVITGIPMIKTINKQNNYYNSAIILGEGEGHYDKRHLVPFGEYTPFKKIFGKLLDILQLPMSDFVEGAEKQTLMKFQGYYIAPYICYEIAYSTLLRADLPQANLLVVMSNDTWFGQSSALGQQRQISQFAAQSTGRYMLVVTNSGETVIISPHGKILASLPIDKTGVLRYNVKAMTGSTPWVRWGNWPVIGICLILLLITRLRFR
jgi:apolipoprotein N-acyltransferase